LIKLWNLKKKIAIFNYFLEKLKKNVAYTNARIALKKIIRGVLNGSQK
jgi:hypothetical protein